MSAGALAVWTATPIFEPDRSNLAKLCLRVVFYWLLFSIIFVPEFPRFGTASFLDERVALGFRVVDLAMFAAALVHLALFACLRRKRLRFARPLAAPGLGFLVCIAAALIYGAVRGGSNFFFDWRGLALGISLYVVWTFWMQSSEDVRFALQCFAGYVALRLVLLYVFYAAGYRDTLLGTAIPLFDGPILSAVVFATLLAFSAQQSAFGLGSRVLWTGLAIGGGIMVLLCMRRTYWAELGIGIFALALLRRQRLRKMAIFIAVILGVVGLTSGPSFRNRLTSLDVTRSDTPYSADNADHVNDLYDAWFQVQRSPLFGIGLGTSYETWHIRKWKSESVMVHNAALHVWLKYGIAGLLCYLWFHAALLRWTYLQARRNDQPQQGFLIATFAYLCAQFFVTLGFAPWPYSELQLTVLMSFLIAGVVASSPSKEYA